MDRTILFRLKAFLVWMVLVVAIFVFQSHQMETEVHAAASWFPERNIFPKLLADPEEINSGGLLGRQDGTTTVDFSIGHYLECNVGNTKKKKNGQSNEVFLSLFLAGCLILMR